MSSQQNSVRPLSGVNTNKSMSAQLGVDILMTIKIPSQCSTYESIAFTFCVCDYTITFRDNTNPEKLGLLKLRGAPPHGGELNRTKKLMNYLFIVSIRILEQPPVASIEQRT